MSKNMRSWLIPFLISAGMAFGSFIGMAIISDSISKEGPPGDVAGAAGALLVVICIVAGFSMSILTIIISKVLHHKAPRYIVLRAGLSIMSGAAIGALGSHRGNMATVIAWLLLLGVPILLSWPWRAKAD